MKHLILLSVVMTFTMAARAENTLTLNPNTNESLMEQVVGWFNSGHEMNASDISGLYSGRCFSFDDPNTPKNSLLGSLSSNAGPGFPTQVYVYMVESLVHNRGIPADYYDSADNIGELRHEYDDLASANYAAHRYGPLEQSPTLSQEYDIEPNGRFDLKSSYRKNGDYIIETTTNLIAQKLNRYSMTNEAFADAGQIVWACYYFKKIGQ